MVSFDIQLVIWDMGGVILRTEDQAPRQRLARRLSMDLHDLYMFVFDNETAQKAEIGQIPAEAQWECVRTQFKLSKDEMDDFQSDFWGGDRMDMELIAYIRGLKPEYKTALLSNAWSDARKMLSERYQVLDAFDQTVFSAEVGLAKPDPKIYHYVLNKFSLRPDQAIFVDDMPQNVDVAQQLGIHAVRFISRIQAMNDIEALLSRKASG